MKLGGACFEFWLRPCHLSLRYPTQKHLGMILDTNLDFHEHVKYKCGKISQKFVLLRKLHKILPTATLLTIYKSVIRPNLDCCHIIYRKAYNA